MAPRPFFSVFTPVYNRRHCLHRVWDSLRAQTDQDFEWIVVDDGSTDGVEVLLAEYSAQAAFPVTVLRQANQGKHFAWNRAVGLAKGELFVPADSDDEFVPETLQRFRALWLAIPEACRGSYSGVNVLCRTQQGQLVGDLFPSDLLTSDNLELVYKYRVTGEKWGCLRTDLLRQRLFPEVTGRSNFPAGWVFQWLALRYKNLCVNEVLRVYYVNTGDSITSADPSKKFKGAEIFYIGGQWRLQHTLAYMARYQTPAKLLHDVVAFWRMAHYAGHPVRQVIADQGNAYAKALLLLTAPIGWAAYLSSRFALRQRR
jgi:glycosyltransferase involved in cell wall biosynthesis